MVLAKKKCGKRKKGYFRSFGESFKVLKIKCRPPTNALTIGRDIDVRRDDNRHNNAKGKEVWNEQGKGRERTEERSQSTDRPSIAEAEH